MLDPSTLKRLDDFWCADFGCTPDEYSSAYYVQRHAGELEREGFGGIYCFVRPDQTTISISPEWFDRVEPLLPKSPSELADALQPMATAIIGPAYIGYSEREPPVLEGARSVDEADHAAWAELRDACLPLEWDYGGSELDQICSGVYSSERLVALAGYKTRGGIIAHISIVTHPDFRGQGNGRRAVAHLMQRAIANGLIPQYQTLDSNTPSIQVASALGFTRYTTSLTIKLPTAGA